MEKQVNYRENPEIVKSKDFDLGFLSNSLQELAVKAVIEQAIYTFHEKQED